MLFPYQTGHSPFGSIANSMKFVRPERKHQCFCKSVAPFDSSSCLLSERNISYIRIRYTQLKQGSQANPMLYHNIQLLPTQEIHCIKRQFFQSFISPQPILSIPMCMNHCIRSIQNRYANHLSLHYLFSIYRCQQTIVLGPYKRVVPIIYNIQNNNLVMPLINNIHNLVNLFLIYQCK